MKKYQNLYEPLIQRVFSEEKHKKDPEKAAKTRLHQLYGAYSQGNAYKKAEALLGSGSQSTSRAILALHASTRERLPFLTEFYEFIAAHTLANAAVCAGGSRIIADYGCGFNPFALPLMPPELVSKLEAYHAFDIDLHTKSLLNRFFQLHGLPPCAECADLAVETPCLSETGVDIAFFLKLLPVLEAQREGRGYELVRATNAKFAVISYPLKSLSGREKGMQKNYSEAFEKALQTGKFAGLVPIAEKRVGNELVYILKQ